MLALLSNKIRFEYLLVSRRSVHSEAFYKERETSMFVGIMKNKVSASCWMKKIEIEGLDMNLFPFFFSIANFGFMCSNKKGSKVLHLKSKRLKCSTGHK